jgi:uncharacterized glyoxalase superfamily protein PhnB
MIAIMKAGRRRPAKFRSYRGLTARVRFEPGVGGRLVEVCDTSTGEGREMARVTVWEPGHVHVDDVDKVYEQAKAAGTEFDGEPADQAYGVRSFGARDPEGHQWWFAQPLRVGN